MKPTHHLFRPHRPRGIARLGGTLAMALATCSPLQALTVTLGASNGIGTSSFNTNLSWSDGAAPAAGNSYVVPSGLTLRSPADSAVDHVFAGDSLTMTGATFNYKGGTNVNTITINSLTLDGATVNNASNSSTAFILSGSIAVAGAGTTTLFSNNASITVTAPISGNSGTLLLQTNNILGRQVVLSGTNTYTGTIQVTGASGAVLSSSGSLAFAIGASGVNNTVGGTGPFTFEGTFNVDLSSAGNTVGDSWTLVNVDTLTETFGATFNIPGFTENENIWTSASGTYQFSETTGVLTRISTDSDGDGLPDAWEYANFGSGNLSESAGGDYDLDFASNLFEYQNGTDPANPASYPDTDDDGLNDGWEMLYFNNSLAQTSDGDPDGDFNSNAAEYAAETDPAYAGSYPDSEDGFGDGLNDGWEIHYFGSIAAGVAGADPDGDLISNLDEFTAGTDPTDQLSSPDTDLDGLADGWEVHYFGLAGESLEVVIAKQAAADDPDADGYDNATESALSTDPTDAASVPGPVAWWHFDELTTGPVPAGGGGEAEFNNVVLDSSGNGNHLRTYNGQTAPEYSTDVPFGTIPQSGQPNAASLYFDGGTDGSWLDLVYTDGGAPVRAMRFTAWTIEASFKMDAATGDQVVFAKDGNPLGGQPPFHIKYLSSVQKFEVGMVDGSGVARYAVSEATISAGQWYSVAATASATELKLWVKGPGDSAYTLQATTAISGAFFNTYAGLNDAWAAGRFRWNGGEVDIFKGYIDEIRISAGVLPTSGFMASTTFVDTDADEMDDNWEMVNFGDLVQAAGGDFDGDGTANLVEFLIGLDPADGSSVFAGTLDGYTLTWPAAPGLTFTVERSTTLGAWEVVGTVNATATTATWADSSPLAGKAFYRVVLDTD